MFHLLQGQTDCWYTSNDRTHKEWDWCLPLRVWQFLRFSAALASTFVCLRIMEQKSRNEFTIHAIFHTFFFVWISQKIRGREKELLNKLAQIDKCTGWRFKKRRGKVPDGSNTTATTTTAVVHIWCWREKLWKTKIYCKPIYSMITTILYQGFAFTAGSEWRGKKATTVSCCGIFQHFKYIKANFHSHPLETFSASSF